MKFTILRMSLAIVLLAAAATSVMPHLTSYVSTSAVVNAPLVSVSAPFNGALVRQSPLIARPVEEGDTLFALRNSEGHSANTDAIRAEISAVSGQIVGLQQQMRALERLAEQLTRRRDAKIEARRAWFEPRIEEAQWDVEKAEAARAQAEQTRDRMMTLSEKGSVSRMDMIQATAEFEMAVADLAKRRAVLSRLEVEEATLDGELGVDLASSDFEQIEYRIDEITVRMADLDARLLGLQTRRASLKTQESSAARETVRRETFSPTAPISGVIWNASGVVGSSVSEGEQVVQILKCSRRFLEVILPERHFEKVQAGTKAWVKLRGSSEVFEAEVAASYGSGARPNRAMQAASPRISAEDGVRVIVVIGEADISSYTVQRSFCDVGRAAEVRFKMDESFIGHALDRVAGWFVGDIEPDLEVVGDVSRAGGA